MATDSSSKASAKFVFKGTVRRTKAANVRAIADKQRTVVVRVDEIVRAPEALLDHCGRDVTVKLAKGERVRKGQRALFYTNGWIFGENLAVQSVGHDAIRGAVAAAAAAEEIDPTAAAVNQQVRQRASQAQVVVTGRVIAVGEAQQPAGASAAAESAFEPISEHAPFWTEAVVEVQQVHKGSTGKKRIVVRFPASTDVQWSDAPKFQVGQEGVFMLDPDKITHLPKVGPTAAAMSSKESYTCLNPAGFQPADHDTEIANALEAIEGEES